MTEKSFLLAVMKLSNFEWSLTYCSDLILALESVISMETFSLQ